MYRQYQRAASRAQTELALNTRGITITNTRENSTCVRASTFNIGSITWEITDTPMDMDEINKLKEDSLRRLNAIAKKVEGNKGLVLRECAMEDLQFMCQMYDTFEKKMSDKDLETFRNEVAEVILGTSMMKYLMKIIIVYPADVYYCIATQQDVQLLCMGLSLLQRYTEVSGPLTERLAETTITRFFKRLLEKNADKHLTKKLPEMLEKILMKTSKLVHQLSMVEASVGHLRDLEFTNTLEPYLQSPVEKMSLVTLATLANIITEAQCCIISDNSHLVAKLVYYLQKAIEKESHVYEGWSIKKCCRAIRNLAKNDANKKLLRNLNVVHTLVDLVHTGDEEDQLESIQTIWALAFDEEVRNDVRNDKDRGVMNMLKHVEETTTNPVIKEACTKCLWTLQQNTKTSETTATKEKVSTESEKPKSKETQGHIMISYQSQSRKVMLDIKKVLEDKGYKVWMDVDNMGGSTLQAMADAIENASVVLICYSRKYKESENCRLEAEYVHEQGKPFIPLKMEKGYKPDGWLGLLIGSRYFIDFSGKYKFEDKLVDLFRELDRILGPEDTDAEKDDTTDVSKTQTKGESISNLSKETANSKEDGAKVNVHQANIDTYTECKRLRLQKVQQVRTWNKDDVLKWLNKNNIGNQGLDSLSGEEVSFLARVMVEAPERIYDFLSKDLEINTLLLKSRIVWALEELSNPY